MNRTVLIIAVLLGVVLLAVAGFVLLRPAPVLETPSNPSFPGAGPGGQGGALSQAVTLPSRSGEPIVVDNFINNGVTEQDPINPSQYYLAGKNALCELERDCYSGAPTDDFDVVYFSDEEAFAIGLTAEPLGEARRSAEQFLMNTLGITEAEMCALNYFLTTDAGVSEQYAGADLGFSFCPGAIPLP